VNEHVAGIARELRLLGHHVTVLAPSTRASDLIEGRRALLDGDGAEVIALGPALPVSRRSRIGVPVGVRANLSLASRAASYDVVHGFEPGLPSLSYLALRDARAFAVATFLSPERLGYPPGRAQRERLLGRIDALVATSEETAQAAAERLPGDYRVVTPGRRPRALPARDEAEAGRARVAAGRAALTRAVVRALSALPGWELVFLRTKPLAGAPRCRGACAGARTCARCATGERGAAAERGGGLRPGARRASTASRWRPRPPARDRRAAGPGRAARARARPRSCASAEDDDYREREQARARRARSARASPRAPRARRALRGPGLAAPRPHAATAERRRLDRRRPAPAHDWSHDCQIPVEELLDHAEAEGLGAIAVTDHNVFGGALEAVELRADRDLIVIPGEEVKTQTRAR
jgi:hypothetical protein